MEDVVLYCQSGSAEGLGDLLETTERIVHPFTCRPPPTFRPWFNTDHHPPIRPARPPPTFRPWFNTDRHPPIRPARPPSVIHTPLLTETPLCQSGPPKPDQVQHVDQLQEATAGPLSEEGVSFPEACAFKAAFPPQHPPPEGLSIRRSWSVCPQGGAAVHRPQRLSRQLQQVVSKHQLHLRHRVRWVICPQNCEDLEQVWQVLNRSVQRSLLPTCNANILRNHMEICVFCDVLYSEQVGRFLKDELQLSGTIGLWVHQLGNVFSM